MKYSYDLKNGKITENQFYKAVNEISKKYRIVFERKRENAINKMKEAFGVSDMADLQVKGKSIFEKMNRHEICRLDNAFYQVCLNCNKKHLAVSLKMASELDCKSVGEFIAVSEYAIRKLSKQAACTIDANPKVQLARGEKPKIYNFNIYAEKFLENPQEIVEEFKELKDKCDAANTGSPRFGNCITAANHYEKHSNFCLNGRDVDVSPTTYFKMATEICQGPMVDPKWTQDGKSLSMWLYQARTMF